MSAPTVLVFDSGLGGLTVYREVARLRPDARYVYAADDVYFPYSDQPEDLLLQRVPEVIGGLIAAYKPDLVVIACNTASTLVLPALRSRFQVPFVGTVPAIKPACAGSQSRLVSVLGTRATVAREYTQGLIRDFAQDCDVTLVGSDRLAGIAEACIRGEAVDEAAIAADILPCFVERDGRRTDVVVLACTHYPLLLELLQRLQPWPVDWLDPAEAIARRVDDLLGPPSQEGDAPAHGSAVFTSGRVASEGLRSALERFGLEPAATPETL